MNIILSRKGFDDTYGGKPSIILPDGTMYSFPIPVKDEQGILYKDIYCGKKSLQKVFHELGIHPQSQKAHLDPDVHKGALKHRAPNWNAAFGQAGAAQRHLRNHSVDSGDIFLFFGTFKKVKEHQRQLQYEPMHPIHSIWGFLEVDQVITDMSLIDQHSPLSYLHHHPHYQNDYKYNTIYTAKSFGTLNYAEELCLTKRGYHKGFWELPGFFKDVTISYHKPENYQYDAKKHVVHLRSASIGQEFVMNATKPLLAWVDKILGYRKSTV